MAKKSETRPEDDFVEDEAPEGADGKKVRTVVYLLLRRAPDRDTPLVIRSYRGLGECMKEYANRIAKRGDTGVEYAVIKTYPVASTGSVLTEVR